MNKTAECIIKCPFYLNEQEKYITCEGFLQNTCMATKFPSVKYKMQHIKSCCCHESGGACPMAQKLFSKYGMRDLMREDG